MARLTEGAVRSPHQTVMSKRNSSGPLARRWLRAPATIDGEGLADTAAANPFALPRLHPGSGFKANADRRSPSGVEGRRPGCPAEVSS